MGVATYVGSKSLDRYVLPLIEKCLNDAEEFVIEETLNALAKMVRFHKFNLFTLQATTVQNVMIY